MSDVEDEEMARVLAESLAASKNQANDEARFLRDLEVALAASKADARAAVDQESSDNESGPSTAPFPHPGLQAGPSASTSNIAGASNPASDFLKERRILELQRIARMNEAQTKTRQKAQKRSYSASLSEDESDGDPRPLKRKSSEKPVASSSATTTTASGAEDLGEMFWNGELRQTANRYTERTDKKPTSRISEIIGDKRQIEFAILSSYANMVDWMYQWFLPETPVVMVNQPDGEGNSSVRHILPNWVRASPFLPYGRGAMHIKLMLLFYKSGRLRVVIPTANFVDYDWRDIENSVWVQDFPRLKTPIPHNSKATDFPAILQRVLHALQVNKAVGAHLAEPEPQTPSLPIKSVDEIRQKWNFSKVTVKLIPSLAGRHEGWPEVIQQGHLALMKAVIDVGAHSSSKINAGKELVLECQGSSIGTYSVSWLNEFYHSAQGISPEKWLAIPKAKRSKMNLPPIKILFPSLDTVEQSIMGKPGAGTMFCREKQWNAATFPKDLFHDANSKRGGVMMHTKMVLGLWRSRATSIIAAMKAAPTAGGSKGKKKEVIEIEDSETEPESDSDTEVKAIEPHAAGWLYVGSHNFTASAWGNVSGTTFTPILNITNYELGILIPLSADNKAAESAGTEMASWVRPPRKYILGRDIPWMQEAYDVTADVFGE